MQHDLDRLIGIGVATISGVGHVQDEEKRWRLEGAYRLNRDFADPILTHLATYADESRMGAFVLELAYALSALTDQDLDVAFSEDATYSDPLITVDNVIDFEGYRGNYSANAARYVGQVIPGGNATPGEKLHLYVRHLHRRIHGGR